MKYPLIVRYEMMMHPNSGRYYCESCTRRFDGGGDCPHCPGEPLLDLGDEEVRIMLEESVDKAKMKRYSTILVITIIVTMPVFFMLVGMFGIWVGIPMGVGMVAVLTAIFVKIFPSKKRMPSLTMEQLEAYQKK